MKTKIKQIEEKLLEIQNQIDSLEHTATQLENEKYYILHPKSVDIYCFKSNLENLLK